MMNNYDDSYDNRYDDSDDNDNYDDSYDDSGDDKIRQFIPFKNKINYMERGLQPYDADSEVQPFYMIVYTSVNNYFRYFFRFFLSE